jgi:hypothetical protein
MTVYYNKVVLGRWLERTVRGLGIRTVLSTVLQRADLRDGRISAIELASLDRDPCQVICAGDWVRVDATHGLIEVKRTSQEAVAPGLAGT